MSLSIHVRPPSILFVSGQLHLQPGLDPGLFLYEHHFIGAMSHASLQRSLLEGT